ncbi:MAG: divalent-cation tolerance protein CutA [Desulfovibrionaceae bacterium]|nr:divalent-cation tolerance protein CutA [Desulfovibrionaceae bacterium]
MNNNYVQIQITTDNQEESERLTTLFITSHLVASVQSIPKITSTYIWNGKINKKKEYLLLLHTMEHHIDEIYALLRDEHSYVVPEYIVLPIIQGSADYLNWIKYNVTNQKPEDEE